MADYLIVGAGINGLLLARELAEEGARVLVLERGRCCREASWAGGGIVSPLYPWRYSEPVTALASWAQRFYPDLAAALHEQTGINPELSTSGLLMLDADDEVDALRWADRVRRRMEKVDSEFIYRHEPRLAAGFCSGLWMPDVANVKNPRLGQALFAELKNRSNVDIHENSQVTHFRIEAQVVKGVTARIAGGDTEFCADNVVLCSGAWTGKLARLTGASLDVEPVKGQMLLYHVTRPLVQSIVLTRGRYAIPRRDGHLLIGSTLEYEQFDKTPTDEARKSLTRSAQELLPALAGQKPLAQWAGLRPAAPQGVPYIGRLPGLHNCYVNAGQFRNGLVLAPASARLLADILLRRSPIIDPGPYRPVVSQLSR